MSAEFSTKMKASQNTENYEKKALTLTLGVSIVCTLLQLTKTENV